MPPSEPSSGPLRATLSETELLRAVLDASVTPVFVLDPSLRVLFANRALADLVGTTQEVVLDKTLDELIDLMGGALVNPDAFRKRVARLAQDSEATSMDLLEYNTDRRLVFKELSRPIPLPDGSVAGRLFLYADITHEKEVDQTKSEFISITSHELRTPMTSIKGSLDLLLGGFAGDVNEETRELLQIAQTGCERLIRLINDVLDLSKIEAGRMQLRLQPISLLDSVQRSVRTIKSYADSFKVNLEVACGESLPEVLGDRDRIDQVVTNLLGNAVKFSPVDGTVTVALRCLPEAVECRVIDSGPGIPRDQAERIFDKFQQVQGQSKKKGGTGLGLAIARALVVEHGGKIWAESEVGRGSQFCFTVPVAPSDS